MPSAGRRTPVRPMGCIMLRNERNRTGWRIVGSVAAATVTAALTMGGCSEDTQRIFRDTAASGLESSAQSLATAVISGAFAVFQSGAEGAAADAGGDSSGSNDNTNSSQP